MLQHTFSFEELLKSTIEREQKRDAYLAAEKTRLSTVDLKRIYEEGDIDVFLNTFITMQQLQLETHARQNLSFIRPEHYGVYLKVVIKFVTYFMLGPHEIAQVFTDRPDLLDVFIALANKNFDKNNNSSGALAVGDLRIFCLLPEEYVKFCVERYDFAGVWQSIVDDPSLPTGAKQLVFKKHATKWLRPDTLPVLHELAAALETGFQMHIKDDLCRVGLRFVS